ncbi:protein translocase subunit SecD [Leifsonia bigeumensis]|uniref:Protein translocase subunit SecD n=1 Tax=Leifsonella bigeumensis TaxID=433643 RepID=A0ABP7FQR7_9MICO
MAARPTPVKKAWRSLTWLLIIIAGLAAINAGGALWANGTWVPKLALDLEGGTQIILAPQLESGQTVTTDQLNQAVAIIRQRIDASGVSEAEINTQGQNVVVAIPGQEVDEETRNRVESSAKLEFRAVITSDSAAVSSMGETPSPSPSPTSEATDSPEGTPSPSSSASPEATPTPTPSNASDPAWVTPELQKEFDDFDCADLDSANANIAPADKPLITCEINGTLTDALPDYKYILGPVEVSGERIADATNGLVANSQGISTNQWGVNIVFDAEGAKEFGEVTTRLYGLTGPQHQFAIVLDGKVISAPTTNAIITDGKPQITGNFTQESSKTLADQLKFGALPIGFVVQSSETISATLGTSQLQSGLIAGILGLILVMVYTLFQYRALGFVTIASLVAAGVITYLVITVLSWREGYRLSLAGVAGLIVAIGFTADSFIIYFERVRDELRDGRLLVSAVEAGWKRALRTVYAAKGTNLLAAVVLYVVAVGNVRGFALTLGITTVIDVLIVVMFTHPMLQLLARTRFFGDGHPLSGLDPMAHGAVYRGAGEFRVRGDIKGKSAATSVREAARRQTIAERKAAEAAELTQSKGKKS